MKTGIRLSMYCGRHIVLLWYESNRKLCLQLEMAEFYLLSLKTMVFKPKNPGHLSLQSQDRVHENLLKICWKDSVKSTVASTFPWTDCVAPIVSRYVFNMVKYMCLYIFIYIYKYIYILTRTNIGNDVDYMRWGANLADKTFNSWYHSNPQNKPHHLNQMHHDPTVTTAATRLSYWTQTSHQSCGP